MLPIVDVSDTIMAASGTTKRISVNNILSSSPTASGALTVTGLVTAGSATITGDLTVRTNKLAVTSSGVGVGVASPGSLLDVRFDTNPVVDNANATNALRVFTTATQATDVGGQIGIGGLFNATQYQAFGTISGKKENSTSGNNAGYLSFGTCNSGGTTSERARFNSSGAFVLAGGTTGANGIGVAFPSTQSASSDANTLDDYEEGTFTATVNGGTTNPTVPLTATGRYTKIGRQVSISIKVAGSTAGGSGRIQIEGLPFANNASVEAFASVGFDGMATFTGSPFGIVVANGTIIYMQSSISSGSYGQVTFNAGVSQNAWVSLTYSV
jgi:hypothetical protein